jgi:hypothetical protein
MFNHYSSKFEQIHHAKYENAYMLYNDFGIYSLFKRFKTITLPWVRVNLNYILA